jgi:Zn-dependent membrane protease YugP
MRVFRSLIRQVACRPSREEGFTGVSDILRASPQEVGCTVIFDPIYIFFVLIPTLAITGWAMWRVKSTYGKWSKVDSGINIDAFDFARRLLDRQGLQSVRIEPTPGQLTDHYDPRGKILRVSTQVADASALQTAGVTTTAPRLSVAAAAVIAHEVGHAMQDASGDASMKLRQTIVPAAQFGSSIAPWLIIAGVLIQGLESLAIVGLIGFGAAVLFTFATLPVEIGASGKALAFVNGLGMVGERQDGAREVLKAAAWTYVAGALTALLTFLYYVFLIFGRRD